MDNQEDAERRRNVFVVFGRNTDARLAMFEFLRSIGLNPIEWNRARALTGEATPYIGTILDAAFRVAQAVVVLFTPDEIVSLRPEYADSMSDPDLNPASQARPNVLFEAGMAMGRDASRTILVELGRTRGLSDLTGRYVVRMGNAPNQRQELAERLRTAGCNVDLTGSDWYQSGRFKIPQDPDFSATSGQRTLGASDINDSGDWTRSGKFLLRINEPKSAGFGLFTVLGEAKNEGGAIRMAFITATFSNAAGQILGSATGAVSQIEAGESKTFTLNSNDDLTASVQSRIQIDSAI
jgi:predicted nucleotide-binding protein